jgi:hypothetical protein
MLRRFGIALLCAIGGYLLIAFVAGFVKSARVKPPAA